MESNLFEKYSKKINEQKLKKEEIIDIVKTSTGIDLLQEEITLEKNKVTLHTTSVKRTVLHNKKMRDFLVEKGYSVSF